MGIDIHMAIVKNGKYIVENVFDGRNSEWFANLRGNGWDDVYDFLPAEYGVVDDAPKEYKNRYKEWCFDFRSIKVGDYMDWVRKYNPDLMAGWVSTYDKWRIAKQGYIPEDLPHELPKEANPIDMHFVVVENKNDCSRWLFDYLVENKIDEDAYIVYCFDN